MIKMDRRNKKATRENIIKFFDSINKKQNELDDYIKNQVEETNTFVEDLLNSIPSYFEAHLLQKPVKPVKKKDQRITTILENAESNNFRNINDDEEAKPRRFTRASKRLINTTITINKNENDSEDFFLGPRITRNRSNKSEMINDNDVTSPKTKKMRGSKKPSDFTDMENEPVAERGIPLSRRNSKTARNLSQELEEIINISDELIENDIIPEVRMKMNEIKPSRKRINEDNAINATYTKSEGEPPIKRSNMVARKEGSLDSNDVSLYEDAIEKNSIMSSTMNASSHMLRQKMMAVTVSLEPLKFPKAISNERLIVPKAVQDSNKSEHNSSPSKKSSQNALEKNKKQFLDSSNESLITEDESDDIKATKPNRTRVLRSSLSMSNDDVVESTPPVVQKQAKVTKVQPVKSNYKNHALFSPYTKASVKKRVQAFEKVVASSPKKKTEATTRVTRTKTRALAVENNGEVNNIPKAQTNEDSSDDEEEEEDTKENYNKKKEKAKTIINPQWKFVTPNNKHSAAVSPTSKATPNFMSYNYMKPLSATRINNLTTNTDSLIPKIKNKSVDKSEEKRQKYSTDDAKLKKEIHLKTLTEERKKKRELKERKIREAREAKEKLELEKRMKAEREKEEKAKLALQAQEKARELTEKKRLANHQRMQEKEERRKQEQLWRYQKAKELEELERQMAEQRKHDQEMEKKKLAQAEAMKQKMLAKKQAQAKSQKPNTYKLESEPDDESDCESNPKHPIPDWAQTSARLEPLKAQSYVPTEAFKRLFNTQRCTPDLSQLFVGISKHRLKRTSSAIWKVPPRVSLMMN